MKFEQNEKPHEREVNTARALRKGDITIDYEGVVWMVDDVDKYRRQMGGTWVVPLRQAVYNNYQGDRQIIGQSQVMMFEYAEDERIPLYDPGDLIRMVEGDRNYLVR